MPSNSEEPGSAAAVSWKPRLGLLVFAAAMIGVFGWMWANRGRAQENLTIFCSGEYAQARTAADTAAIDRRVIVAPNRYGRGAVTCRQYRQG